ncbi:MAG: diguanylate cyclase [Anaerolineales bacterium]
MKKIIEQHPHILSNTLITVTFILYAVAFAAFHDYTGASIASLAVLPVIVTSWFYGARSGVLMAIFSVLFNIGILSQGDHSLSILYKDMAYPLGTCALLITGIVTGKLSHATRQRTAAIAQLEQYERERRTRIEFLELLNAVTATALEADSLQDTLEILTEQIVHLFNADDGYFSLWDADKNIPIPTVAYGSLRDVYPYMTFEAGEQTLSKSVIEAGYPIAIPDIGNSPFIGSTIAAIFPNHSMLGIPLIVQRRGLGVLILGYNRTRQFGEAELTYAETTAEQVALVLSKSLLLDEERKQVKRLTALHDVALTSIEADQEDLLIERVSEIIGKNLFPDNFGIMLLDSSKRILHAHPSYRFYGAEDLRMKDIALGEGITGEVAQTGIPQRIGNVRSYHQYVDVDDRTLSELCVPIKFKDNILGVVNAESMKRNAFTADDERLLVTLAGQLATAIEQMRKAAAERKWLDQLAHSNDLIYSIAQITTQIEKSLTASDIIQTLGKELQNLHLTCMMAMYDDQHSSFTVNYTSLEPHFLEVVEEGLGYPLIEYTFPRSLLEKAANSKGLFHPIVLSQPEEEIEILFNGVRRPGALRILKQIGITDDIEPLRVPLIFEKNLLGILWIWGNEIRTSDLPIISMFAKQVGISLERARLFQEVQSLALTDPLTGLHNRRNIFELGRVEFSRAHRMNRPFCCMMLDLDHFKQINDKYGHPAGDQVLREFADRCKRAVREVDFVGRYGGEELIIIMPETELAAAFPVAERLRKEIANAPIRISGRELNVTVSIGLAQKDENTLQLETLIARADQAMYIAKHKGRNQVATSK